MAELSGFRRFSYQAQRRQSYLPRKSIVSVATTAQPTGHSWLYVLRSMYKQTFSLCTGIRFFIVSFDLSSIVSTKQFFLTTFSVSLIGFGLCTCAIIISNYLYYFDIYDKVSDQKQSHDPIEVFAVVIYFLGACIGSIVCGLNQHTWPAKKSNVSDSIEDLLSILMKIIV